MVNVAVIGGGIVGASAALHLALAGVKTTLIEGECDGRATSAGAGIVAPGTSLRPLPPFFQLAKPAVAYYPTLVEKLRDLQAGDTGYTVCGKLMVAENDQQAEALPAHRELFEQRRSDGMANIGSIQVVSPTQAQEMLPILGDVKAALFIPEAARVDGAKLRDAMTKVCQTLGVRVIRSKAVLKVNGNTIVGVEVDGESIKVDAAIVSAGAWTNSILEPTGFSLAIAPQKGQILHIDMPGKDTSNWPILDWTSSQYMLAFGPNRVVCGATREFDSGFDTRVTPAGVKEVLDEQLRICPGLANGTLAEVRVGLRPYAEDAIPLIGKVPGWENLVVCSGHGPSGLQLGPYSGLIAAELAQGHDSPTDISSFRLDRSIAQREVFH